MYVNSLEVSHMTKYNNFDKVINHIETIVLLLVYASSLSMINLGKTIII